MMQGGEITATVASAGGLPGAPAIGGAGGGGGGGGKGAAGAAAKAAQMQADQLAKALEMQRVAEAELEITKETDKIEKMRLESAKEKADIQKKYSDLIADAKSIEEESALEAARTAEIKGIELELEQELAELKQSASQSIRDEIQELTAKLQGKEEELRIERELAQLRAAGYSDAEGMSLIETRDNLKALTEQQDAAKASAEELAGSISGALTDSLRGLIDGSMSAEEALANAFKKIVTPSWIWHSR